MSDIREAIVQDQTWHFITIKQDQFEVTLLDYGAAIYSIKTPNKDGVLEEVLLQYKHITDYAQNDRHLNATIGPTAGRIENATFTIENTTVTLDKNHHDRHNLHGGSDALSYTLFDFSMLKEVNRAEVTFRAYKPYTGEGYPGSQKYVVIYTITPGQVNIEYLVDTDEPTLVNVTNHAYFNLSGNLKTNILSHHMSIDASRKMTLAEDNIPVGIESIAGTLYDYQEERPIQGEVLLEIDDPYLLNDVDQSLVQASLFDPVSQRQLDVLTSYPCIVCYTDNFPMPYELAFGAPNEPHMGVCFEAQNPPNGIHVANVEPSILTPQEHYYHQIRFLFSVRT